MTCVGIYVRISIVGCYSTPGENHLVESLNRNHFFIIIDICFGKLPQIDKTFVKKLALSSDRRIGMNVDTSRKILPINSSRRLSNKKLLLKKFASCFRITVRPLADHSSSQSSCNHYLPSRSRSVHVFLARLPDLRPALSRLSSFRAHRLVDERFLLFLSNIEPDTRLHSARALNVPSRRSRQQIEKKKKT